MAARKAGPLSESISPILLLIRVFRRCLILLTVMIPLLSAQEPAVLQVRVIEGEGVVYPVGSRATRGITVQVTDETGRPVDGASVSFRLPAEGAGGAFATGAKTEIATTRADGRASVWGMQWNRTVGSFEIRVTAEKGQTRAGTVCSQSLTDALSPRDASSTGHIGSGGHKWLWITLAVAGAAGAGVAASGVIGKSVPAAAATSTIGVQIGAPSINLGRPN